MLIKKKSQIQEKRTAKQFRGRIQPASGALHFAKGDIRTGSFSARFNETDFLIENKYTDVSEYVFKLEIWRKIKKEALKDNLRIPLMQVDINSKHGDPLQLVIMDFKDFLSLGCFQHWEEAIPIVVASRKSYVMIYNTMYKILNSGENKIRVNLFIQKENLVIFKLTEFLNFLDVSKKDML